MRSCRYAAHLAALAALAGTLLAAPVSMAPASASAPSIGAPTAPVAAEEPQVGACYNLSQADVEPETNDSPEVPCSEEHTAQTVEVVQIKSKLVDDMVAASGPCSLAVADALGIDSKELGGTLAQFLFYRPTDEQWAAGERWMRCDLVLYKGDELGALPEDLSEITQPGPNYPDYVACLGADGNYAGCDTESEWEFVNGFDVANVPKLPDQAALQKLAKGPCTDAAGDDWYARWPGEAAWAAGQTTIWCFRKIADVSDQWSPRGVLAPS